MSSASLPAVVLAVTFALGCAAQRTSSSTATQQQSPSGDAVDKTPSEPATVSPHPSGVTGAAVPASSSSSSSSLQPRAILVTIDGVRWQDVFEGPSRAMLGAQHSMLQLDPDEFTREGLLPRIWELVGKRGIALGYGAGCGVVRPRNTTHISLPGYFEIFTGRRTTCMSNVCPRVTTPTVIDVAAAAGIPTASLSSWDMLDAAATVHWNAAAGGTENLLMSAGTTRWPGRRPLEDARLEELVVDGEKAKPFPAPNMPYRPDRYTAAIALEYLRVRKPRFMHVGLGDVDEHGHHDNYPGYLLALREADTFLGDLADALETMHLFDSTTVIVTTDHGRGTVFKEHGPNFPESGRAWVIAFGGRVPKRGQTCAHRDVWLTDIAPTLRAVLGLPRDTSPDVVGKPIDEILH